MSSIKAIIDTDPGTDDSIALLMAIESMDILGITIVGGNASLARTTRNTLAILEYADREDIPVAKGSSRPLRGAFPYAYSFHGPGGISVRLPTPRNKPCSVNAVEFTKDLLMANQEAVTLVALGPLTNIAKLLKTYPEVSNRLAKLVVMGGAVGVPGNVTPYAEFNFYSDPLAASFVLSSPVPINLVDLKVCRRATINRDRLTPLLKGGKSARLAGRILTNWFKRNPGKESYELCDPLAMAVALEPDLVTVMQGRIGVETESPELLGQTSLVTGSGTVNVSKDLDCKRVFELFFSLLN